MPVITVDGKKVAVPKETILWKIIIEFCHTTNILINGEWRKNSDLIRHLKEGDVITSKEITFTFHDKEVKVPTGIKLVDVLPSLIPEEGRYNIFLNGRLDTNDETVLHDGDDVLYQKVIPIRLQECITYIPEETTLLQLYYLFRWSAKNGLPTVNGKKEPLCYIVQKHDVVKISKNH